MEKKKEVCLLYPWKDRVWSLLNTSSSKTQADSQSAENIQLIYLEASDQSWFFEILQYEFF